MQLQKIPVRHPDGTLDTQICLTDDSDSNGNLSSVLCNFGSMNNGGLSKLIQFSNSVNSLLNSLLIEQNQEDGVVSSSSFGLSFFIAHILLKRGIYTGWNENGPNLLEEHALLSYPILLAALLDPDTKPTHRASQLARRFYSPVKGCFSSNSIQELLRSAEGSIDILEIFEQHEEGVEEALINKLHAWVQPEWNPSDSIVKQRGGQVTLHLAAMIKSYADHQTSSNWEAISEHLREVRIVNIEINGRSVYALTRLSAMQTGIIYRLGVPCPPRLLCEPNSQPLIPALDINAFEREFMSNEKYDLSDAILGNT